MIQTLVDTALSLLLAFGLPALLVLFFLKGAIVGKIFPTSIFLPGYLLAVSAPLEMIVIAILVASVGYASGQLCIYWIANQRGIEAIRALPRVNVSDRSLEKADRLFTRYSGVGIVVTNLVPYVGTFVMIPAGLASYPVGRAAVYALTSTLVNYVFIVWVVFGSLELLGV